MEEDEEVILKDSALYAHLRDAGFTEFEVSTSQNSMIGLEKNIENTNSVRKNEKNMFVVKIYIWLMSLLEFAKLKKSILRHFAVKLIKSKILVENDLLTLENFSNTVDDLISGPDISNFEEPQTKLSFHKRENYFFFLSFASGLFAFLIANYGVLICILSLTVPFGFILYSYLLKVSLQNKSGFLDEIVQSIENADKIILKTSKIMNEIKVIGKVLSNDAAFPEASYEVCLCEGIFKLLERFSSIFIAGHLIIEKKRNLSEWGSLKKLFAGRLSTVITSSEEEKIMMTQMKIKFVLFLDQSSAFLTELLLHLEKDYSNLYWMSINDIISTESIAALNQQIQLLTKLHNMANNYWFDGKENKSILSLSTSRKSYESVKTDVHGALNSLYVHSRLAVNNILLLRNFVEETVENKGNAKEVELLDNVQKKCDSIKNEFLSSMGCLDEVWDRAQRYYFPKLEQLNTVPPIFVKGNDTTENLSGNRISILGLTVNVPVDEVFEATVGEGSNNVPLRDENDAWRSNIKLDKTMKRKQMERCRRVLQEIQPILQKRREMWEEREQMAMQRKNERKFEVDEDAHQENRKNFVINQLEEESERVEEIPLVIPFCGIGVIKSDNDVADIKKTFLHCDDDYDSDEERLKVYRKVKQELYEDELRRLTEDKAEEYDDQDYICNQQFKHFLTKENEFIPEECTEDCVLMSKMRAGDGNNDNCHCHNDVCNCICSYKRSITNIESGRNVANMFITKKLDRAKADIDTNSALLDENSSSDRNENKNKNWKPINLNKPFGSNFECLGTENELRYDSDDGENSLSSPSSMSAGMLPSRSTSGGLTSSLTYPSLSSSLTQSPIDSPVFEKGFESSQIYDCSITNSAESFSEEGMTAQLKMPSQTNKLLSNTVLFKSSEYLNDEPTSDSKSSETFACGNDSTDCDNHSIDWSTCGFPSSKNLRLEDRFMPDHDGWLSCGSFNPFLSSETLQRNPTLRKFNLNEEVFGGIGEMEHEQEITEPNYK